MISNKKENSMFEQDSDDNKNSDVANNKRRVDDNDTDNDTPYSVRKKEPKKDLLRMNTNGKKKKKKNLFGELTFVEQHVDTFYIGLNENIYQQANNPKQAKILSIENENADELVKDWVHPDSQLVNNGKRKNNRKTPSGAVAVKNIERSKNLKKIKPLKFLNDDEITKTNDFAKDTRIENATKKDEINNDDAICVLNDENRECAGLLCKIFDKTEIQGEQHDESIKTPSKYTIYVEDTPVEYYGLSVFERRKLGI